MYGNKPVDGIDYSHLKSVEDVQKEAADAVKGFIKSMKDMPEEMLCGKKLFKKARSCNAQMYLCGELAEGVQEFLPLKSGRFQRMTQINESSLQHQTELGKISDLEHEKKKKDSSKKKKEKDSSKSNSDFTKYIDFRAQSIKDILGAIRNVADLTFKELSSLSEFLIEFATFLEMVEKSEISTFICTFQALRKRNIVVSVQTLKIDWNNIESIYASYSQEIQAIISDIVLVPKGTELGKMSIAFHSLAQTAGDFAMLAADNESIKRRIKKVIEKEEEMRELVVARKNMNDQESTSSDDDGSGNYRDKDMDSDDS